MENKIKLNVLSLFNGAGINHASLNMAGIECESCFVSEIEPNAIKVAEKNYPNDINLGDVRDIDGTKYKGKIDLFVGGSPCQSFSFCGKQNGMSTVDNIKIITLEHYQKLKEDKFEFEGQSYLFWEYVRLLREIQPKYFLLENVVMSKAWENIITKTLGVQPIMINSAKLTAQNRKRLYWANWHITQPKDKGVLLKDIIHENNDIPCRGSNEFGKQAMDDTFTPESMGSIEEIPAELKEFIVPFQKTLCIIDKEVQKGKAQRIGYFRNDSQSNRVYSIHGKAIPLMSQGGGGAAKMGQYLFGCITPDRINKRQNGQRFNDGKKFYTLTAQDQHGILIYGYIRKLTPMECERLQGWPDNYTLCEGVSKTQRYKMIGNGWTMPIIAHIYNCLLDEIDNVFGKDPLETFLNW